MDGTATINAKVDSLRLCGFVQNLACAKPRRAGTLQLRAERGEQAERIGGPHAR